jgi:hypothetical protein
VVQEGRGLLKGWSYCQVVVGAGVEGLARVRERRWGRAGEAGVGAGARAQAVQRSFCSPELLLDLKWFHLQVRVVLLVELGRHQVKVLERSPLDSVQGRVGREMEMGQVMPQVQVGRVKEMDQVTAQVQVGR